MKSIKTKKSFKTNNSNKSRRHITGQFTAMMKLRFDNVQKDETTGNKTKSVQSAELKNFDMIRTAIGERPKQIYNTFLEGEYAGIIKPGLVENRDYVFVSDKVWNYLIDIYGGEPEFRRTGFDQIDLEPKIIRIYSGVFKGEIDYSSEIVREVSNTRTIEDIMIKSLEISEQYLKDISIFYRTFGMASWEKISNHTDALIELTTSTIILLVYIEK